MSKIKISTRIFSIIYFFLLFWCITFTAENFLITITNMIKTKIFDLGFHAANNSHFGQWVMAILLIVILPWYLKFTKFMASKFKLWKNLWWQGFIGMILCYISEFTVGVILNIILKLDVWDYSSHRIGIIPLNLLGQITLYYFWIWYLSGIIIFALSRGLYCGDSQFINESIKSVKDTILALFTKGGDITKINPDFYNIEADYMNESETPIK